ncbi:hypothetical protein NQ317_010850 [Molorchus minor]|uniref:Nudix hydrolase domain-containing protein n=1 Tax=Molorchus minor TaxID=1323400 RepID=A0ABQ9JZT9_9CUCU|nr:hypothetical protein NQ317_010850 [Molorchus minor]
MIVYSILEPSMKNVTNVTQLNLKTWRESASLILAAKSIFCKSPNREHASDFNYKVLGLQRSLKSKFMANAYVFPGGNVSKTDSNPSWMKVFEKFGYDSKLFKELYPEENVPLIMQNDEIQRLPKYLSLRICAIRETFEECGILICKSNNIENNKNLTSSWASYIEGNEIIKWQQKIHDNTEEFLNLCTQLDLCPDVCALKNWSNWKTPSDEHFRFNAMFFFTNFSQMPSVNKEEKEIQNVKWYAPSEYLQEHSERKLMLPIPQFYEISRLKKLFGY